jgi:hypothetical protein
MKSGLLVVPVLLALAACGGPGMVSDDAPVASPYDGPMHIALRGDEESPVAERAGAAARALECERAPYDGGGGDYDTGLASAQDSAEDALEDSFAEDGRGLTLPSTDYRVERRSDHRVLFSFDVGDRTRIAFIAHDGITDVDGRRGWGIESWAQCDPAELPDSVTDDLGIGVWEDTTGRRQPVDTIQSFDGAEHCGWQDITFLRLGTGQEDPEYVRDTGGELATELRGAFDRSGRLPPSATDTGFRRDGRRLWLDHDRAAAYLVAVDDPGDVEVWPASKYRISCS